MIGSTFGTERLQAKRKSQIVKSVYDSSWIDMKKCPLLGSMNQKFQYK